MEEFRAERVLPTIDVAIGRDARSFALKYVPGPALLHPAGHDCVNGSIRAKRRFDQVGESLARRLMSLRGANGAAQSAAR